MSIMDEIIKAKDALNIASGCLEHAAFTARVKGGKGDPIDKVGEKVSQAIALLEKLGK